MKRAPVNNNGMRRQRSKKNNDNKPTVVEVPQATNSWSYRLTKASLEKAIPINYTVSIAIPSSLVRNAQSPELRAYLIGQIARSCALYEVDEIVIFIDTVTELNSELEKSPSHFMCRLFQYLETPSYLRKSLFPFHQDFKFAGLLPVLEMPHHMRRDDNSWFREGVTLPLSSQNQSQVDVGMIGPLTLTVDQPIPANIRVTVQIDQKTKTGIVVSPNKPRKSHGLYWGYQTRLASSFSEIFTTSSFTDTDNNPELYDCIIGVSEKGSLELDEPTFELSKFSHMLIVFGGNDGIEGCIEQDEASRVSSDQAHTLFQHYLNICPSHGSKNVRTEEAIMSSLARLRPIVKRCQII